MSLLLVDLIPHQYSNVLHLLAVDAVRTLAADIPVFCEYRPDDPSCFVGHRRCRQSERLAGNDFGCPKVDLFW